ncbi:MAG: hypothetical protein R3F37_00805 [Candidatus Competibacteraceae bacterium]
MTLMDFDVPQDDGIHFFYVLPYSPDGREAIAHRRNTVGDRYQDYHSSVSGRALQRIRV